MKILLFFVACAALIVEKNTDIFKNFIHNHQSSEINIAFPDLVRYTRKGTALPCYYTLRSNVVPDLNGKCYGVTAINARSSSRSSDYQESTITVSAVNLSQPHILSINTSAAQLQGKITLNRKVIKQIKGNRVYVNLSPYLSVGEHTVEISARYSPASSLVNVEFNAPATNVTQQTSGSGLLNSTLKLSVY